MRAAKQCAGTPLLEQDAKVLQEELDRIERIAEEVAAEDSEAGEAPATTGRGRGKAAAEPEGAVDPELAGAGTS